MDDKFYLDPLSKESRLEFNRELEFLSRFHQVEVDPINRTKHIKETNEPLADILYLHFRGVSIWKRSSAAKVPDDPRYARQRGLVRLSTASDREYCHLCCCWVQLTPSGFFRRHSNPGTKTLDLTKAKCCFSYRDCSNSGRALLKDKFND